MENALLREHHPDFIFNFCGDGMAVFRNIGFYWDPIFRRGYNRGVQAAGTDCGTEWRFHTCLWAAQNALRIEGDFVECGVGRGFMSSGIMEVLEWNSRNREFYLFDTFEGVVEELCTQAEIDKMASEDGGVAAHNAKYADWSYYPDSYESVKENFSEWTNVTIVKGAVPYTLESVTVEKVAFLHIDMNSVIPEMGAIDFFWPKLSTGASVVLDDYAHPGYQLQYDAWNEWGRNNGVPILTLPTGQGLILKT